MTGQAAVIAGSDRSVYPPFFLLRFNKLDTALKCKINVKIKWVPNVNGVAGLTGITIQKQRLISSNILSSSVPSCPLPETALLFSEHQREKVRKKTVSGRLFKVNHISRRTWNFAVRVRIFLLASQETSFLGFLFYWLVWRFCLTSEKGRPTDTDCFILEALFSHYIQQTWLNYRRAVFLKGPAFPNTQHFLKQLE